ncbi:NEL-type E3 ubiquitin ligase domain-containing protein [Serratia symbiotica]|uniref:NEL-type E3 ubiquitin ligase domain-containing protein n=2 Tax=Serratia symbiotica TaxID=138074 RepID=UPI001AE29546|nr:NEL-type E3 ubiquitin ligase domain-containing protein [Serratia symbiotica]QTP13980.1 hypothetical protein GPZ83_0011315 [Serratia symbiotica]
MLPVNNNPYQPFQTGLRSARDATSSDNVSHTTTVPLRPDEYYALWSEWEENAPPGMGEKRDIAVARMRECLETGRELLDLAELQLSSLPESLPPYIRELIAYGNHLSKLPDNLPETLIAINACDNILMEIPANIPPRLISFYLENNYLEIISSNLPDTIEDLNLAENRLSTLPAHLPNNLRFLDLRDNQFQTIPASLWRLPSEASVYLDSNPFSARTLRRFMDWVQMADYTGPHFLFSMSEYRADAPPRPLGEAVKDWLSAQTAESAWAAMEKEDNAAAFSAFLSRLGETQNARENPAFKARVSDWLTRLAETPALRETTFAVAQEATTSCEDRVTLAWNDMQKVALVYDVESGTWDDRLPELMTAGCEMFRLEQLEQAARDKVKTLRFVDEVEVYLAYQTGLRDALRLTSAGERMRYGDVSGVTQEDLDRALVQVREREKRAFPTWLAQWTPWKTALYRASPGFVENMQEQQTGALNDTYRQRVDAELKAAGVEGIADAEVAVGKKVWDEMTGENETALTRAFLQNRYCALMADKRPEQALKAVTELASVAASAPAVAAMAIRPGNVNEAHPGSLLATRVAASGMAPLAEAWVSLLHLLYENEYLDKEEVISALLPHKKEHSVGSLAHAIAGAAWNSEAATKLCALLSDVAGSDENSRQDIMARLSLKLPGSRLSQLKRNQAADFYEQAKKADKFSRNEAAKAHLKEGGLVPENRELYRMVSRAQTGVRRTKNPKSSFEALQEKIKEKITPQVLALLHTAMAREKAELDRVKITTREQLDGQGKEVKKRTQQAPPHSQNRQEETVDWEIAIAQAAKRQRNQEEVAG